MAALKRMSQKKTKAQIAEEMKRIAEIRQLKELAAKTLIPSLQKHEHTIYQAGQILDVFKQVSMGKMQQYWTDKPFAELGMAEELTKDDKAADKDTYAEIIEALKDVPVSQAMKLFDTFTRVIEMYGNRQVMKVKISELPFEEIMGLK